MYKAGAMQETFQRASAEAQSTRDACAAPGVFVKIADST